MGTTPVNRDKPDRWKVDISQSVDMYNSWFMKFAPDAYRSTRIQTTKDVEDTLQATANLTNIGIDVFRSKPGVLPTLRMSTCPPIAVDRLIGLAKVPSSLVNNLENQKLPTRLAGAALDEELTKIGTIIQKMADPDIFVWLGRSAQATELEVHRAATIVADRLCGAVANPIIRNAQEQRQLAYIKQWLENRGYKELPPRSGTKFDAMPSGTFSFRLNVPVKSGGEGKSVNIPVDAVIMPKTAKPGDFPFLIEAKSAGDFTNVNKRRKEEAQKMTQLKFSYGDKVRFALFLCGYFDSGYLGYEAAEGIDWVWEHRIDDLAQFGI
jgi:hypothetical protein